MKACFALKFKNCNSFNGIFVPNCTSELIDLFASAIWDKNPIETVAIFKF